MSLNITQSNNDLTLQVHQSNVKATLSVTQSINKLHITAVQNSEVVELQPIITVNALAFVETDPIFQASEASLFVAGDKSNLDNQSGVNTGDETTSSIQTKRPLKTINNKSLEGSGNIQIDYNDLDNLPATPIALTKHSELSLDDGTNPHGTTKGDVGLGDVPNLNTTEAVNKAHEHANFSVLNATEESFTTALKNAYNNAVSWITTNGTNLINHLSNISNPHNVTKSQVGLSNVDNTSDVDKPISTATQNALDLKLDKDTTAGVERAYIINADGSQGTKATSELVGTTKKTENLFFQDAVGSTVKTITADQKNMHQSRFLANASPFGQLGLTFGNGIPETSGVINLSYLSDLTTPQITGDYVGKVKKIVFSYSRNVNESSANTNVMIRVMADTKYQTDMQLIAEHNLVSTTAIGHQEHKVEIPVLTHLPLSAFSNIGWCIRSNNATAQQFSRIKINVIVEEI